jgi:hypothetical protein
MAVPEGHMTVGVITAGREGITVMGRMATCFTALPYITEGHLCTPTAAVAQVA